MKRTLTFVVVLSAVLAPELSAQCWVEGRTYVANGIGTPRIASLITKTSCNHDSRKIDAFVWFEVSQKYSQAYGGILYSPKSWLQFAVGAGLEQAKNPARTGGYIWMGSKKQYLLLIAEYGGSGLWGKAEYNREIGKGFGIGAISERFKGTGPRVQYQIPRIPVKIWGAPMIYKGAPTGLIGARVSF